MALPKDSKEFIGLLISHGVDFVVAGAFAVGFWGRPRFTGDLDILIRAEPANAARLLAALETFGFGNLGLSSADFCSPGRVVQLGVQPNRIDILTSLTGVDFEEVWSGRRTGSLDGLPVCFLGRAELVKNKRATGRPQDLADLEALGEPPSP
jgi:glycine/D-amino acid oxidase-like deaminating enzyme